MIALLILIELLDSMTIEDQILLVGILVTVILGFANLWVSLWKTRITTFINSVTAARVHYLQDLRKNLAEFCGLAHTYNFEKESLDKNDRHKLISKADTMRYLIRLYLNPSDQRWDTKMMGFLDDVIKATDRSPEELLASIRELVLISQFAFRFEWAGIKEEARKGNLDSKEKEALSSQIYVEYEEQRKAQGLS